MSPPECVFIDWVIEEPDSVFLFWYKFRSHANCKSKRSTFKLTEVEGVIQFHLYDLAKWFTIGLVIFLRIGRGHLVLINFPFPMPAIFSLFQIGWMSHCISRRHLGWQLLMALDVSTFSILVTGRLVTNGRYFYFIYVMLFCFRIMYTLLPVLYYLLHVLLWWNIKIYIFPA